MVPFSREGEDGGQPTRLRPDLFTSGNFFTLYNLRLYLFTPGNFFILYNLRLL